LALAEGTQAFAKVFDVGLLRFIHQHVTENEAFYSLRACAEDENEAIEKLTQISFLQTIRKQIALDSDESVQQKIKDEEEEDQEDMKDKDFGDKRIISRKRKDPERKKRMSKLKLDDALNKAKNGDFDGWSEARIRAYNLIDKNPNAYYYRFNAPGVPQKNGPWSAEEKRLFFQRIKEFGVNGQWGMFSMTIPGRVGYQCSNFYRHLIETGKIVDENYVIDGNGRAHYLFSKGICQKRRKGQDSEDGDKAHKSTKRKKKRKKLNEMDENEEGDDAEESDGDDDYRPPSSVKTGADPEDEQARKSENPLPGFIDPITLGEVEQPAISPSGHVMDYKSWSRCLSTNSGICPLTKKPLKKRDLVILTWKNIDQYINKIINMNS